jgi:nucleoside-diphosphate-sugar epimerase
MLTHAFDRPVLPQRVVVIGAGGFLGGAIVRRLRALGVPVAALGRGDVDLLAVDAADRLASLLRDGDAVVAAAAIAPCKTAGMLRDNMTLSLAMVRALQRIAPAHVVNIGSDAVYRDQMAPLAEDSPQGPDNYHGIMHMAREIMVRSEVAAPLALLRPTLVYGAGDPHNGYGPNQFLRQAARGEAIALFGEGEEQRDHVFVDDVAELAARVLLHRSSGALTLATGVTCRFAEVARTAVALTGDRSAIVSRPRPGPMPHNGYRAFDVTALRAAFADFTPTPLRDGMARMLSQEAGHGRK